MFTNPAKNIGELNLLPGMKVADFGAGSGFYALEAAKLVGDSGRVYAIDIQDDLLVRLKNQARGLKLFNIETIKGDLESLGGTHLAEHSLDAIIISNILFQIEHKDMLAKEANRILKPTGKILIIDWADSFGGLGPHKDHVVTEKDALNIFETAGFTSDRSLSAGDHHYGLLLTKKS